jgi:hypothetical protein
MIYKEIGIFSSIGNVVNSIIGTGFFGFLNISLIFVNNVY